MSRAPDLSRLCLDHAPDPTGVKTNKTNKKPPNSMRMWQNVVPNYLGIYKSRNKRQEEEEKRRNFRAEVLEQFDKAKRSEGDGLNLYSLKVLLPRLAMYGWAMSKFQWILPDIVKALARDKDDSQGLVLSQRETRELLALNILKSLYQHSFDCEEGEGKLCYEGEGARFRKLMKQALMRQHFYNPMQQWYYWWEIIVASRDE